MGVVEYNSNNSGGSWWLDENHWQALLDAGWDVSAYLFSGAKFTDDPHFGSYEKPTYAPESGRYVVKPGEKLSDTRMAETTWGLPTYASKSFTSLREGVEEWERVTGLDPRAIGCNCCGPPHSFTFTSANGTREYVSPDEPETGSLPWDA